MKKRKACEGYATIIKDNMEVCVYCGCGVVFDLIDHPFFGFSSTCPEDCLEWEEFMHDNIQKTNS